MQAGKLDRQITIETVAETMNSRGEPVPGTGTTFATVWAKKVSLSGTEARSADQRYATSTFRWEMRYVVGVTTKMRLNEAGIYFDILDVDETKKRHGQLHIIAVQRGA